MKLKEEPLTSPTLVFNGVRSGNKTFLNLTLISVVVGSIMNRILPLSVCDRHVQLRTASILFRIKFWRFLFL